MFLAFSSYMYNIQHLCMPLLGPELVNKIFVFLYCKQFIQMYYLVWMYTSHAGSQYHICFINLHFYLMDLGQKFSEVGAYFHYISCCGFTRF